MKLPTSVAPLQLFGQEINPSTFAMARMNAFLHDMEAEIALGDTMRRPAFTDGDGRLRRFDIVTANPMWNQDFAGSHLRERPVRAVRPGRPARVECRLGLGPAHGRVPRPRRAGWRSCSTPGRSAGEAATSGSNRERDIRKQFVEEDLVEAVVLLPENLFYNTTAPASSWSSTGRRGIHGRSCWSTHQSCIRRADPRTS